MIRFRRQSRHELPRRHPRPRPVARAGRPVVHADPGRPRRRRDQDRAPRQRRRHAQLGPALPEGPRRARHRRGRLLPRRQPQQALGHAATSPSRRARRWCASWRATATCSSRTSRSATWRATASTASSLRALNPRLVYCSITGFGQTGPYRERAGYDYAVQGMGGLMSVTGERDDLPAAARRRSAWRWPTCSPACTPRWRSWPRCATASAPARASTSTWRCSTRRSRCWPTWAPTTWSAARCRGAPATRTRTSCPTRCSRCAGADGQDHIILAVGNDGQFAQVLRGRRPAGAGARPALRAQRGPRAPPRRAGAAARSRS